MEFHHKPTPKLGDVRIVKKFLWIPLRIGDITKWLETASYRQVRVDETDSEGASYHSWRNECWI